MSAITGTAHLPPPPQLSSEVVAALPDHLRRPHAFLEQVAAHGDVVAFELGGRTRVLLGDAEAAHELLARAPEEMRQTPVTDAAHKVIGDGLILSSAPRWRPRRLVIQRELSHRNVRRFADRFVVNTTERLRRWQRGSTIDLQAELGELALDNLGDAIFAADFRQASALLRRATDAFGQAMDNANAGVSDLAAEADLEATVAELDAFLAQLVAERRADPDAARSILDVLAASARQDDEIFNDRWSRDEAMTLITGGHETTAFSATAACLLLGQHPEVTEQLRAEIVVALEREVAPSALVDEVPLTRHVVEEALRLYPPLPAMHRTAVEAMELGGHRIEAGTILVVSPWLIQRDPRSFDDPLRFDPWRFAGERRRALARHAYLPFGAGPRICVGNHFALLEAAMIVALTALHVELRPTRMPELTSHGDIFRFEGGLEMSVTRNDLDGAS